jgi:hypothetical protein
MMVVVVPEREVALQPRSVSRPPKPNREPELGSDPRLSRYRNVPTQRCESFALKITCARAVPHGRLCVASAYLRPGSAAVSTRSGDFTSADCRVVSAHLHGWDSLVRHLIVLPPYATSHTRTQSSLSSTASIPGPSNLLEACFRRTYPSAMSARCTS